MNKQFRQDDRVRCGAVPYEGMTAAFVQYLPRDRRPNGMDCESVVDGDTETITPYRSDELEFCMESIGEDSEREGTEDYVVGSKLVILIRRRRMLEAMWVSAKESKDEVAPFIKVDAELFKDVSEVEKRAHKAYIAAIRELDEYVTVTG